MRREVFTVLARELTLVLALIACSPAQAQTFPDRNVTLVVTSAAGALTDTLTRAVSQRLTQLWNQTVVVENRGGGGHTLAVSAVKSAAPDGHTLLSTETGLVTSQPHLYAKGKLAFDPDTDFVPVSGYAAIPQAILVRKDLPTATMAELVALAKSKPNGLTYGTAGLGTAPHTAMLLLESLAGIKLTAVHYRGAAPALNDLIAGHIDIINMGPSIALPAVRDGKIRMLGFGGAQRVSQMPEVPTIAETVPGYDAGVSFGLLAPAGTPAPIVTKISADVQAIIADAAFRQRFLEPLLVQPMPGSPDAFAAYLRKESDKWSAVIKAADIKIE